MNFGSTIARPIYDGRAYFEETNRDKSLRPTDPPAKRLSMSGAHAGYRILSQVPYLKESFHDLSTHTVLRIWHLFSKHIRPGVQEHSLLHILGNDSVDAAALQG
jgi:hypothetical protein